MEKVTLLNYIERYYDFQLTKPQLHYFFTTNKFVVMTAPRQGGKTFVTSLDAISTCTTPNKRVCIVINNSNERRSIIEYINEMVLALEDNLSIENTTNEKITFTNGSCIYLKDNKSDFKGYRLNKVIISEPDFIEDIERLMDALELCTLCNQDAQIKLIGTHMRQKYNLISYMMNPYYEKIQMTFSQIPVPNSTETIRHLRDTLSPVTYQLEIMNEITPSVFGEMFRRRG